MLEDNSGKIRTSENISPIKPRRRLAKIVRINFFITLEVNQRLAAIQELFTQKTKQNKPHKNQLNLGKNTDLCSVFSCPIPISLCSAMW